LADEFFPVAFAIQDGKCRWYLDHILLQEYEATEDLYGKKLQITLPPGGEIQAAQSKALPDHGRFLPIDISGRYNCANPVPPNSPAETVPFQLASANTDGCNSIDIGRSWVRETSLNGDEASNRSSFGGRWSGAFGGTPTRFQFRVPYAQYTAIYLLATYAKQENRTTHITAQFYRPTAGFPKNFIAEAIDNGGGFQVIKIPVNPGALQEFSDLSVMEVELTGDVHVYRGYPDPLHYSMHGGGLPSGIQVFAMTLEPTNAAPVILGMLYAEYASPEMMKKQPKVQMPEPPTLPQPFNPIQTLNQTATLTASEILRVEEPDHYYDGTRGVFHFREMPEAAYYDIYLSRNSDGTNALKLGNRLQKSGVVVHGFLADTDFYAFVVWYDKQSNNAKPSHGFKFNLQDNFGNK
jgi:hypothetical protein